CCRQAPTSWRKGAVVMTLVVSAILICGLYLGWHLEAYPTSYFLIGTGAIAAFDILAVLPFQLWKTNIAEIDKLQERLRPKLQISFSMNDSGCVRPNTMLGSSEVKGTYFRLKVETAT